MPMHLRFYVSVVKLSLCSKKNLSDIQVRQFPAVDHTEKELMQFISEMWAAQELKKM